MTNLLKLRNEILIEMYAQADPPLDFQRVLESPEDYSQEWYLDHTLDSETQQNIVDDICNQNNVSKREKRILLCEAMLNLGPQNPQQS